MVYLACKQIFASLRQVLADRIHQSKENSNYVAVLMISGEGKLIIIS
jgi:hypothetical protein